MPVQARADLLQDLLVVVGRRLFVDQVLQAHLATLLVPLILLDQWVVFDETTDIVHVVKLITCLVRSRCICCIWWLSLCG